MIFSSWNPSQGEYTYWNAPHLRIGLGDDLPKPRLPSGTSIGVASTEAGRPLPPGSRKVGSGQFARGSIIPLDRSGLLSGAGVLDGAMDVVRANLGLTILSTVGGYFLCRHLMGRKR